MLTCLVETAEAGSSMTSRARVGRSTTPISGGISPACSRVALPCAARWVRRRALTLTGIDPPVLTESDPHCAHQTGCCSREMIRGTEGNHGSRTAWTCGWCTPGATRRRPAREPLHNRPGVTLLRGPLASLTEQAARLRSRGSATAAQSAGSGSLLEGGHLRCRSELFLLTAAARIANNALTVRKEDVGARQYLPRAEPGTSGLRAQHPDR
jgi:hypothetical protein